MGWQRTLAVRHHERQGGTYGVMKSYRPRAGELSRQLATPVPLLVAFAVLVAAVAVGMDRLVRRVGRSAALRA
jgi:hypothetical protein